MRITSTDAKSLLILPQRYATLVSFSLLKCTVLLMICSLRRQSFKPMSTLDRRCPLFYVVVGKLWTGVVISPACVSMDWSNTICGHWGRADPMTRRYCPQQIVLSNNLPEFRTDEFNLYKVFFSFIMCIH